jgi:hypothetical protein
MLLGPVAPGKPDKLDGEDNSGYSKDVAGAPYGKKQVGDRPLFIAQFAGKVGKGALPPVKYQHQTFNKDSRQGNEKRPVVSADDSAVKDVDQAGYHENVYYRVNKFNEKYLYFVVHG